MCTFDIVLLLALFELVMQCDVVTGVFALAVTVDMNLPALYCWSRTTNNLRSLSRPLVALAFPSRRYATRRDNLDFSEPGSLLSHSLDTNRSEAKHDTVGPFQLGLSQAALRKGEKVPKWSELSTGGKGV